MIYLPGRWQIILENLQRPNLSPSVFGARALGSSKCEACYLHGLQATASLRPNLDDSDALQVPKAHHAALAGSRAGRADPFGGELCKSTEH